MTTAAAARELAERIFADLAPTGSAALTWQDPAWITISDGAEAEGFDLDLDDDTALLAMKLADRMQTVLMESSHSMLPPCPLHPGRHPLSAARDHGGAWWTCPQTHAPIRAVVAP